MRTAGWLVVLQVTLLAAFPRPDGYVNDFADVLTSDDEAYLENYLRTLEAETSAEVAIVTVTSMEGMTIEEYANRLFADWGIGKAQTDNGVLLLVAPDDRAVRIEVGYGAEGILPDGLAGEIIARIWFRNSKPATCDAESAVGSTGLRESCGATRQLFRSGYRVRKPRTMGRRLS